MSNNFETLDHEITGLFKDVTQVMWKRLCPILGLVTTQHLFRQAVTKNLREFPWLRIVEFTEDGPQFLEDDGIGGPADQVELRKALSVVVKTVLDILTVLTGDILTRDLESVVRQFVESPYIEMPQASDHSQV